VTGKSAQIPLFVWLPDAMAGPTPVSALIHAATMVTAGVYLLARMSFLFVLTPSTMTVVAIVGVLTALLAAAIAVSQNDIKKVLAYSTVSQLGFMVAACGVGAFAVAIFHVVTHAFFKALLFLGAGSVIHGLGGEQDLRKMGGLRRTMPVTYWTMLAGSAALAGIVPFAGFFSKDAILYEVWLGSAVLWAALLLTAGLTAFYVARLMILAFFGDGPRGEPEHAPHEHVPHESPRVMTVPLVVLAALSVAGGWVGIGAVVPLIGSHEPPILRWLAPVTGLRVGEGHDPAEYALALAALAVAIGGAALAYFVYLKRPSASERLAAAFGPLRTASERKFWVDELYAIFPVGFTVWLAKMARGFDAHTVDAAVEGTARATQLGALGSGWVDRRIVDGVVGLVGGIVYYGSFLVRAAQTGLFQTYALAIVVGLAALFVAFEWGAIAEYVARFVGR
jgi:NADH-quinone oxidoreductase subunit L